MQNEFLFAGFGGQGVMFAGQLLAYAAMDAGLEVTWIPSYGPEMRGGTAHCIVVVSDKPIGSPIVRQPTAAIVLNNPSFLKYAPQVKSGGVLIFNETLISAQMERSDIMTLAIPATQMADKLGNTHLANVLLLGAALSALPVVPMEAVRRALETHLPAHHRDLLSLNLQALEAGVSYVKPTSITA